MILLLLEKYQRNVLNLGDLVIYMYHHQNHVDVSVRFNPDVYGCLIARVPDCTILLYGTGRVVCIGAHSLESLKSAVEWLKQAVESALKTRAV